MQKRWNILSTATEQTQSLQKALGINATLCSILVQRGITEFEQARQFFRPQLSHLHDPFLMKDMQKAVDRIIMAIDNNERILVFGDYDVDGTTSVASMYRFLKALHPLIDFYIPHRYREGYGISQEGIRFAQDNYFSLVISLDCGIKSVDLIQQALDNGIDFIVCDHHLPDEILPPAFAILNPKQSDCPYPYKELCGCGVGFKLMQAISIAKGLPEQSYLKYLDLVATAIAADIVPLSGENRTLAFLGLQQTNTAPCAGIKALIQTGNITSAVNIGNLIFVIAPRINAAGRMDDARKAVQLFVEEDLGKALQIAQQLHSDNSDRKEADLSITEEALQMIRADEKLLTRQTTVLYRDHWHKGVVGIVASRLIDSYYRPTIILTRSGDIVAGSARSVSGFNLYEAIHACREHLLGYGGHFAAAGMTLLPEQVEAFSNKFNEVVAATITEASLVPEIIIDAEVNFQEFTQTFYNILSQMEPFGPYNTRPIFVSRFVKDTGASKVVKDQHIRFVVKQGIVTLTGIGFNMASQFHLLQMNHPVDIVYTLDMNEWNGEKYLQMKVIDFKLSEQ
ncbi:exonuclease RecJ [Filimonas lacunae]|uniref:Single-stranded-DNA-specific exonuclease RecJ n=1 Tax=Filimonas lacunae TaxID=477680 RepID=A0A173MLT7_9BACT|nr:single-stranded-DNA-specific exonuclease RecJ [Filimonas lacunae]BAV08602.1 single-stranded-DNA-specific exonuclease RecJ [Filimonas lacunae]SIS58191.1 exonuclease RecJ [Filimonas lacunae]